ncbi:MAG TPA: hypothetical protein VFV52_17850 [Bacilli bacterium]|nr:hypothetical protein [Bacilli bacterium]
MGKKVPFAVLTSAMALAVVFTTATPQAAQAAHATRGAVAPAAAIGETQAVPAAAPDMEVDKNLDTDGDGLKDWFEQSISHAYKADTDGNGVTDDREDADGDGLSNIVEQERGTNPSALDTDGDGLSDYAEVYTNGTNPLKYDTDGDNLSDGVELNNFGLNPLVADEDGDGVLDGLIDRSIAIPSNDFGITGTMTGKGDIPNKLSVRETPILMVQQVAADATFDLLSLDPEATFNVSIPVPDTKKADLRLFRYVNNEGTLEEVGKQHLDKKTNTIEATFTGGGSFVLLSKSEWMKTKHDDKLAAAKYKGKFKPFKGKAKIDGMGGVEVDAANIAADGTFEIVKSQAASYDGTGKQLKAKYKVDEMTINDSGTYMTVTPLTTESGQVPTILVHGFNSNSDCWGLRDKWDNGNNPSASSYVYSYETFTGSSYSSGYTSTYSNIDTHYITSISDSSEMGAILDSNKGFTPNVDLFTYEYDSTGHVGIAANGLRGYVNNLYAYGIIPSYTYINLLAHSKGGLVSRYYIENLNGSYEAVDRLVTIGTPNYGSDWSTFGDMDRDDSDLWLSNNHDAYCDTFTNSHPYTRYFGFGGFEVSAGDLNATSPNLRGVWSVGKLAGSYDQDVRDRFAAAGNGISWWSYADIEDSWVNIDSAMGSDHEPDYDGTFPTLDYRERWYVFHETYGDHSAMRKYYLVQNLVSDMLKGYRD